MKSCVALLGAAAAAAFVCLSSFAGNQTIGDGGTLTLSSTNNPASNGAYQANPNLVTSTGEATLLIDNGKGGDNYIIYNSVLVNGGKLTIGFAEGSEFNSIQFANGIRAINGGKVVIDHATIVYVGRASLPDKNCNWPVCDLPDLTFNAEDARGLVLREYVTLRNAPAGWTPDILANSQVALQGTNPLNMGETFCVSDYDVLALTAASIPKLCVIDVEPGRYMGFRPSAIDDWKWTAVVYNTQKCRVNLLGMGSRLLFRNEKGSAAIRSDVEVTGTGEIEVRTEKGGTYGEGNFRCHMNGVDFISPMSKGESISIPVRAPEQPFVADMCWTNKVAHWFDAADANSVIKFAYDPTKKGGNWTSAKNEYKGHPIVIGWKDKVKGSSEKFLYNTRIWNSADPTTDYVLQVMPYLMEGADGLNGMPYLSFGTRGTSMSGAKYNSTGALVSASEARRLQVWSGGDSGSSKPSGNYTNFGSKYCIMVFGSQQGGGKAILDSATGSTVASGNGDMARGASSIDQNWLAYRGYTLWIDGERYSNGASFNPATGKPDGGWQVVAVDMTKTNTVIQAIGSHKNAEQGGQNYAEIIFFDEAPNSAERVACEKYLAEKWGLTGKYRNLTVTDVTLSGPSDAVVELYNNECPDVDNGQVVTVAGDFKGRIEVPTGRTMVIADLPKPPTEADLPAENRVGWYDPDFEGAIDENASAPGGVDRLHARTLTGVDAEALSMAAQYSDTTPTKGRYPFTVKGSREKGLAASPVRTWMDFSKNHKDETSLLGNTLRFKKPTDTISTTDARSITIRQAFMALDTSLGGGNPIGDNVAFNGQIKARNGYGEKIDEAIWNPNNTVKMTKTWLDKTPVDGTAHGYRGRPEILSFVTATDFPASYFAYYNPNHNNKNYEIIGETILYSAPLGNEDCDKVQDYLMYKWLGDLQGKYSDLSGARVNGAGTVKCADVAQLPSFNSDFTGTVELTGTTHTFVLGETIERDVALAIPDGSTIVVKASGKVAAGTYTLLQAQSLTADCEQLTLSLVGGKLRGTHSFAVVDNALVLNVACSGTTILIR